MDPGFVGGTLVLKKEKEKKKKKTPYTLDKQIKTKYKRYYRNPYI
jgi:hypothetical protein